MRLTPLLSTLPLAVAALAVTSPQAATAQDYDMDCKLLLCLPGGFPAGCADALDHMIDRIRDGKSPIGTCSMSGGGEYDDYEIGYSFNRATNRNGWECPEGTSLYHDTAYTDGSRTTVHIFCYENSNTVRMGDNTRTYYTGTSRPERTDFTLDMTMNASAETPYETGTMRFNTGRARDWMTDIYYSE